MRFGTHPRLPAVIALPALLLSLAWASSAQRLEFPGRHNMVNVTAFGANGSDQTSDQAAIEAAIGVGGNFPNPKVLYFPAGTYIVEDSLRMWGYNSSLGGCCATFQGQGPGYSVIRLKDNASGYGNASAPKPLICTSIGTNNGQAFRFQIYDLTVEIGTGNAGAMAVDYITNNRGAIDNVEIKADGDAFVGLEMTRSWPGPCLVKNLTVRGFTYGIRVAQGQYSITLENITLEGQKTYGLFNQGNYLSIHNLVSVNTVPAIRGGSTLLVKGDLRTPQGQTSTGAAVTLPASNWFYGCDVSATGYAAVVDNNGTRTTQNPLAEYSSTTSLLTLFGDAWGSLKLPIKDAPEFHDNDTNNWVCTADHLEAPAAGGTARASLAKAIEYAAANGKTTVYAQQQGQVPYPIFNPPVVVPPQIKNLVGFDCQAQPPTGIRAHLDIVGNTTDPLVIEGWNFTGVTLHHESSRPVVIKHCDVDSATNSPGAGDLFIEDMDCKLNMINPQNVWIRQYNPEDQSNLSPNFRILNNGGRLWILGIKTEGSGNIITTKSGGSTELLGNLIYPNKGDNLGIPAFICEEACMSLMFVQLQYGTSYQNIARETRGGVTKTLTSAQVGGWIMPMFVANKGCAVLDVKSDPTPGAEARKTAPRPAMIASVSARGSVTLPAGARGFALFTTRGEMVWRYERSAPGALVVEIPRGIVARGVGIIRYDAE